jgi:outer membrane protein TolC
VISRRTICGVIGALLPIIALIQPVSGQVAPTAEAVSSASSQSTQSGQSSQSRGAGAAAERLSLDAAIALAVAHNRSLASANSQVAKATADLAAAKTRRMPSFEASVSASYLLTPVEFSFPQGAFGEIPGVGPFPVTDTTLESPRAPSVFVSSQVAQPLTQLFRINLGIQNAATAREIERERVRGAQQDVVNAVKRQYFAILQTASALSASDEAIALYRELDRTLTVRVAQRVALKSDALDVGVKLAQEELSRTQYANALATHKEQLNLLLGRDVRLAFETDDIAPMTPLEVDMDAIRTRALAERPDVREARLKVQQADLDRRIKKAEQIPDVSLAVSYVSNFNIDVLPKNLAGIGVQVKWEPWDWGRKNHERAAKSQTLEQARLAVRETEDRAVVEINSRYRTLTEARAMLQVTRLGQETVREKLRVKTNQFQIQAALLADVLNLRADLAATNDRYQQALLAFWTAKADFEHATGEDGTR